jgi:hypothetical protein
MNQRSDDLVFGSRPPTLTPWPTSLGRRGPPGPVERSENRARPLLGPLAPLNYSRAVINL